MFGKSRAQEIRQSNKMPLESVVENETEEERDAHGAEYSETQLDDVAESVDELNGRRVEEINPKAELTTFAEEFTVLKEAND